MSMKALLGQMEATVAATKVFGCIPGNPSAFHGSSHTGVLTSENKYEYERVKPPLRLPGTSGRSKRQHIGT